MDAGQAFVQKYAKFDPKSGQWLLPPITEVNPDRMNQMGEHLKAQHEEERLALEASDCLRFRG